MNSPGLLLPHRRQVPSQGCWWRLCLTIPTRASVSGRRRKLLLEFRDKSGWLGSAPAPIQKLDDRPPLREPTIALESAQGEGDMSQT